MSFHITPLLLQKPSAKSNSSSNGDLNYLRHINVNDKLQRGPQNSKVLVNQCNLFSISMSGPLLYDLCIFPNDNPHHEVCRPKGNNTVK